MLKLRDFKDRGFNVMRTDETSLMEQDWSTWLVQKCVRDSQGKKYFINVYVTDHRLSRNRHLFVNPKTFTLKLYFERGDLIFWIDIQKDKEFQGVQDIESLADEVWFSLNCDYYDKREEISK